MSVVAGLRSIGVSLLVLTAITNGRSAIRPGMPAVPPEVTSIARQYLRRERALTSAFAVTIGLVGGAAVLVLPLLWGLVVALGLLVLFRFPVFRTEGHARLWTDDDPETVYDAFTGATPPSLALQWGIADAVREEDGEAVYDVTYFFGLRSVELRVTNEVEKQANGSRVVLTVTADGEPWGTYVATLTEAGGGTEVAVEVTADRRFGLARLPQQFVAKRYRDPALTAQGYEVRERDISITR